MIEITQKQQKILAILSHAGELSSSEIFEQLAKAGEKSSLVTVKRELSRMTKVGLLQINGSGPSTVYQISALGRVATTVDAKAYCSVEPDRRYGLDAYNFSLLPEFPPDILLADELASLNQATAVYEQRIKDTNELVQKKELERLVIELSWKSSKIEGNTYTLLDTEKLILENKEAPGHSKDEATMILNHKDAFAFVHSNKPKFKTLTGANLQEVHALLIEGLGVGKGFRTKLVGVLGSKYRPLDNIHQVTDAVSELSRVVSRMESPYAKALVALIGISYIQPFEDGNKRTSRLMANAILMAHSLAPLSYRSVDEEEYREAMLVFYELNSIIPIKKIFVGQYDFAARTYAAK